MGKSTKKDFSLLAVNLIPDTDMISHGQCIPLYWYEKPTPIEAQAKDLRPDDLIRRDAISDWYLAETQKTYKDQSITKEDIFYYIYGILHSKEYREKFSADLKKSLPRIPFVKDFWGFSKAGRKLVDLHLNYESVEPYPGLEESGDFMFEGEDFYKVKKMRPGKKNGKNDLGTIIYNDHITVSGIPEKAYEYVVNGKSAIEWITEKYKVDVDKASGIVNDPNDWIKETGNERYILDLLKSIVNVSVQTVDIVNSLPKLEILETEDLK